MAGHYEVCAVVKDDLGIESNNRCCVAFDAIPLQAFVFQLTWAEATGDMDLHLSRRDNGTYCVQDLGAGAGNVDAPFIQGPCPADSGCRFNNCNSHPFGVRMFRTFIGRRPMNSSDTDPPEWDGVPGRTSGDPVLDIDDLSGLGPEQISLSSALPGSYGFGATTFTGGSPFTMTMRLFVAGRLEGEWQEVLTSDFWEIGAVHVRPDQTVCVEDFTDGDVDDECPGLDVDPVIPCTDDVTCDANRYCDLQVEQCRFGCRNDASCPSGQVCSEQRDCVGASQFGEACVSAADCQPPLLCGLQSGTCVESCASPSDCVACSARSGSACTCNGLGFCQP